MADQLSIYNNALIAMGERRLVSLTEARESRFILDDIWNEAALVNYCLEEGFWSFATRASQLTNDANVTPAFGWPYAFSKPIDYLRLKEICLNEFFTTPLLSYTDEPDYWYTITNQLYIRYISNDINYGMNIGSWPGYFTYYVELELAARAAFRITKSNERREEVEKKRDQALRSARSKDGMNEATVMMPLGTWTRSRMHNRRYVFDGIFNNTGTRDY